MPQKALKALLPAEEGARIMSAAPLPGPRWRFLIGFYLLLPLAIGFIDAWRGSGRTADWPMMLRLGYELPFSLVSLWALDLASRAAAILLRPWRAPLWLILTLGVPLSAPFSLAFVQLVLPWYERLLPPGIAIAPPYVLTPMAALDAIVPMVVMWVGLNMLVFHGLRQPRYGFTPSDRRDARPAPPNRPAAAAPPRPPRADTLPGFVARSDKAVTPPIHAIEAQHHYVKVHDSDSQPLVLYRFRDAIAEMDPEEGQRVHRSWWVRLASVEGMERGEGTLRLRLVGGLIVPVSRTYRLALEARLAERGLEGPQDTMPAPRSQP